MNGKGHHPAEGDRARNARSPRRRCSWRVPDPPKTMAPVPVTAPAMVAVPRPVEDDGSGADADAGDGGGAAIGEDDGVAKSAGGAARARSCVPDPAKTMAPVPTPKMLVTVARPGPAESDRPGSCPGDGDRRPVPEPPKVMACVEFRLR